MKFIPFFVILLTVLLLTSCHAEKRPGETEITQIAKEAYLYGYPVVGLYRHMATRAVDRENPRFFKPFNEIGWLPLAGTVVTATDQGEANEEAALKESEALTKTALFEPDNKPMAYGSVWMDLRREPYVVSIPATGNGQYFSVLFISLFSDDFDYVSAWRDGNGGGRYLLTPPGWKGEKPSGINRVIAAPSDFVLGVFRVHLDNAFDTQKNMKLLARFGIVPLSQYAHTPPVSPVSPVDFPEFNVGRARTPEFFNYLNFALQFCAVAEDEKSLLKRFAKIGIIPGKPFDYSTMSETEKKALIDGMAAGQAEIDALAHAGQNSVSLLADPGNGPKADYAYRAYLSDRYLYGHLSEELVTVAYETTVNREKLNGKHRYELRFEKDRLPPAEAFWTLSVYPTTSLASFRFDGSASLDSAVHSFSYGEDGSLILYLQEAAPEAEKQNNWLKVPRGNFYLLLQLYRPGDPFWAGEWLFPQVRAVNGPEKEEAVVLSVSTNSAQFRRKPALESIQTRDSAR